MKIDCEGGENTIWGDPASMLALRLMDYIAMEIHHYALHGGELPHVVRITADALAKLGDTFDCQMDGVHFWANRRLQ